MNHSLSSLLPRQQVCLRLDMKLGLEHLREKSSFEAILGAAEIGSQLERLFLNLWQLRDTLRRY